MLEPEEGRVSDMNSCETIDRPDEPDRLVRPGRPRQFVAANADLIRRLSQCLVVNHCWSRLEVVGKEQTF